MRNVLNELKTRLILTGMTSEEADELLFDFLHQYAREYVKLMDVYQNDPERYKEIINKNKA